MNDPVHISGSIRRRLTLLLVSSAAVLATVLYLLVQGYARQLAETSQDNILLASVTSILDSVGIQEDQLSVDLPYAALSMLGNVTDDRVFYQIRSDGELLTGYGDLPVEGPLAPQQSRFATAEYLGDTIRIVTLSRRLSLEGQPTLITASVAQTRNGQATIQAEISRAALALGVAFFVLAALLAVLTARTSIRPLRQLAASVARRGPSDLRPVSSPVPAEMAPLVASLNGFIRRLETSLNRSEDFIAEAAHRVRTPLATVRAQAENALHRVERPENRKSLKEMVRAIDESSRAAGQLLDHAVVSFRTDHLAREDVSLAALVEDQVERLRPVAHLKDIELLLDSSDPPHIAGDPVLIQNAIRNILDNAIKYAPEISNIEIRVNSEGDFAVLSVRDYGGGFPEDAADLTERFVRGANVGTTIGSGLGLTIVRDVVEAHGGHLEIRNRNQGDGACVSLYFPAS